MSCLKNRRSGTGQSTEFMRQPIDRGDVRRLLTVRAYLVRTNRLHVARNGLRAQSFCFIIYSDTGQIRRTFVDLGAKPCHCFGSSMSRRTMTINGMTIPAE